MRSPSRTNSFTAADLGESSKRPTHPRGTNADGKRAQVRSDARTRKQYQPDALAAAWGGVVSLPSGTAGTTSEPPKHVPCPQGDDNCSAPFCDC
jgi:hypothetical protein